MADPQTLKKRKSFRRSGALAGSAKPFDREAELPKLIGLWPSELRDYSQAGTARLVAMIGNALRAERQRGAGGHWTYDLSRHIGLSTALKEETSRLRSLKAAAAKDGVAVILGGRGRSIRRSCAPERLRPAHKRC